MGGLSVAIIYIYQPPQLLDALTWRGGFSLNSNLILIKVETHDLKL